MLRLAVKVSDRKVAVSSYKPNHVQDMAVSPQPGIFAYTQFSDGVTVSSCPSFVSHGKSSTEVAAELREECWQSTKELLRYEPAGLLDQFPDSH